MKNEQRTLKEGLNEWNIASEEWARGVYYFVLKNEEKLITRQVIKL